MIRGLCRSLLHLFFRTVRIDHVDRLPTTGPVIVVANHHSGLVDPAVLIATLPRAPRFLAKAALWRPQYVPLRPFLLAARAIPVYRRKDGGGDNSGTFTATRRALEAGELIALFGEGVSHDEPGLLDLKTGAARIALGVDGLVQIVPVGLIYDDRAKYRSHVAVAIGEPIAVRGRPDGDEDREAVTELTERIAQALELVAPSWESWQDHDDAQLAARLTAVNDAEAEYGTIVTQLNRTFDEGEDVDLTELRRAVSLFRGEVDRLGLDIAELVDSGDSELGSIDQHARVKSMLWWPLVALGRLLNVVPYTLVRFAARGRDLNFQATFKILLGLLLYPSWWATLGVAGTSIFSLEVGIALVCAAVILGYFSASVSSRLRYLSRERALRGQLRRRHGSNELIARRSSVVAATRHVLAGSL